MGGVSRVIGSDTSLSCRRKQDVSNPSSPCQRPQRAATEAGNRRPIILSQRDVKKTTGPNPVEDPGRWFRDRLRLTHQPFASRRRGSGWHTHSHGPSSVMARIQHHGQYRGRSLPVSTNIFADNEVRSVGSGQRFWVPHLRGRLCSLSAKVGSQRTIIPVPCSLPGCPRSRFLRPGKPPNHTVTVLVPQSLVPIPCLYSSAFQTYAPAWGSPRCASTRKTNWRAISVESTGWL
jgi:hypothetical protein